MKQKRNLTAREDGDELEGSAPLKRLRIGPAAPSLDQHGAIQLSPTEIEPLDEDEQISGQAEEPIQLGDLYLETVPISFVFVFLSFFLEMRLISLARSIGLCLSLISKKCVVLL